MDVTIDWFEDLEKGEQLLLYFVAQCALCDIRSFNAPVVAQKLLLQNEDDWTEAVWWKITDDLVEQAPEIAEMFEKMYPEVAPTIQRMINTDSSLTKQLH